MMRKLMTTTASLTLLLGGAVVALEAVGLIFRAGPPQPRIASIQTGLDDPETHAAALLWQRQEEAEARRRADQDRRQFEAEWQAAVARAAEEEKWFTDAVAWAERYRRRREAQRRVAALDRREAATPAEAAGKPQPPPLREARDLEVAAAAAEPGPAPGAGRLRGRSHRKDAGRAAPRGCPFLAWLQAVVAPPASRRGAT
jgi:hypothetical protein